MSKQEYEAFLAAMARVSEEYQASEEKARELLLEEGAITEEGIVTEPASDPVAN